MAESDFSWLKIASFFGAAVLLVVCFVAIATGIKFITDNNAFNGVVSIIAGLMCGAGAVLVYKNYQKKSDESRYGKQKL